MGPQHGTRTFTHGTAKSRPEPTHGRTGGGEASASPGGSSPQLSSYRRLRPGGGRGPHTGPCVRWRGGGHVNAARAAEGSRSRVYEPFSGESAELVRSVTGGGLTTQSGRGPLSRRYFSRRHKGPLFPRAVLARCDSPREKNTFLANRSPGQRLFVAQWESEREI